MVRNDAYNGNLGRNPFNFQLFDGIDIDREEWEQGYGLFRLDTTPAGSGHPDHLIPNRSGNVNLYLKFGTETPAVLNLIVYAEFQNQLEIDRNRRVVYDLSQGA